MKQNHVIIGLLTSLVLFTGCASNDSEDRTASQDTKGTESEVQIEEQIEEAGFPRTIEVNGQSLTIEEKPEKILPLSLDAAEIVLELVDPSKITATTEGIDNPNLSTQTEIASSIEDKIPSTAAVNIDPEQLLSYDTDLLLLTQTQGEDQDAIDVLKEQDIAVLTFPQNDSIDRLMDFISIIGEAVGEEEKAASLIDGIETDIKNIQETIPDIDEKPSVLILTEIYTGSGAYILGKPNLAYDIIELAGAKPAIDEIDLERSTEASIEQIIKMDPDYIFLRDYQGKGKDAYNDLISQPGWDTLRAFQNDQIEIIPNYSTSANAKLTESLQIITDTIYEIEE